MKEPRVVITGAGLCLPSGLDLKTCLNSLWNENQKLYLKALDNGNSAGLIPVESLNTNVKQKSAFQIDHVSRMVLNVAGQCLENGGLTNNDESESIGIIGGSMFGSFNSNVKSISELILKGTKAIDPEKFPLNSHNYPISLAAIEYGLKGPITAFVKSGTSGFQALSYSAQLIRRNSAKKILAIGYDELIGINMALMKGRTARESFLFEGCGGLLIEDYQSAINRGIPILGEILLCGNHFIPNQKNLEETLYHHLKRLEERSTGISWNDTLAVLSAGGTPLSDEAEKKAVQRLGIQSTVAIKPEIGNYLGASGIIETIAVLMSQSGDSPSDPIRKRWADKSFRNILVNSYDFTGNYTAAVFRTAGNIGSEEC